MGRISDTLLLATLPVEGFVFFGTIMGKRQIKSESILVFKAGQVLWKFSKHSKYSRVPAIPCPIQPQLRITESSIVASETVSFPRQGQLEASP